MVLVMSIPKEIPYNMNILFIYLQDIYSELYLYKWCLFSLMAILPGDLKSTRSGRWVTESWNCWQKIDAPLKRFYDAMKVMYKVIV